MNMNESLFLKINAKTGKSRILDTFGRAGAEWVVFGMAGWYITISLILNFGNKFAMYLPILTFFVCSAVGLIASNIIGFYVQYPLDIVGGFGLASLISIICYYFLKFNLII